MKNVKMMVEEAYVGFKDPVMVIAGVKASARRQANKQRNPRRRAAILAHGTIRANKLKKLFKIV